jgi:Flp pilus assembly protein TadD
VPLASLRWLLLEKLPLLVIVAVFLVIAIHAENQVDALHSLEAFPLLVRFENALISYAVYLRQFFYPAGLSPYYEHPGLGTSALQAVGSGLVLLSVTSVILLCWRQRPYLAVGWCWYLGTLVPVIGLLQVGLHSHADRYMYIPILGLLLMVVWSLAELAERLHFPARVLTGATVLLLLATSICCWNQLSYWRDGVTLWGHAVEVTSNNSQAHNNLGVSLQLRGRNTEARKELEEAVRLCPGNSRYQGNYGAWLAMEKKYDEALPYFEEAVRLDPNSPLLQTNLGSVLVQLGRVSEAIPHFRAAVQRQPGYSEARLNLGVALKMQGAYTEALQQFQEVLRQQPQDALVRYHLAQVLDKLGDKEKAHHYYQEAVYLDPSRVSEFPRPQS